MASPLALLASQPRRLLPSLLQPVQALLRRLQDPLRPPWPARRFVFNLISLHKAKNRYAEESAQIQNWFHSEALRKLQELDISFSLLDYVNLDQLPPSVFRLASTLLVAKISFCEFPNEIALSLSFPLLKQLTLWRVSISEVFFHGALSACHVLESLYLEDIRGVSCLRISSPTLRSVGMCACSSCRGDLIIGDAPSLERLLLHCPRKRDETIRVIRAPKLQILGPLSPRISKIENGNVIFQSLSPTSLNTTIATVKVLALEFSVLDLNALVDVLRCFPCLEKLHVICYKDLEIDMKSAYLYDPLYPVQFLETHLKKVVLKNYEGSEQDVAFAKFFVLNAKVLKEIIFGVRNKVNMEWVDGQ